MPTAEPPSSIHLVTLAQAETSDYHLLQLPDEVLAELEEKTAKRRRRAGGISRGDDDDSDVDDDDDDEEDARHLLTINGRHGDEAVICSRGKTYALRQITQSNTILLCSLPSLDRDHSGEMQKRGREGVVVRSNVSDLLEMVPIMPRLQRIGTLLYESRFEGDEEEGEKRRQSVRMYTPAEVRSIVQTSTLELQAGLNSYHVVLLNGCYRMVSQDYLFLALEGLMNHVDLHAYRPSAVPLSATLDALVTDYEIRREVGHALLTKWFGRLVTPSDDDAVGKASSEVQHIALDSDAIVRFLGKRLLAVDARQPVLLEEWHDKWKKRVGQTFAEHVDLSKIKGEYLLFPAPPSQPSSAQPLRIQYYPKEVLPLDPAQRFQDLFLTRSQWLLEDLLPYLDDIAVDKKKRDALLLKFARTNRVKVPVTVAESASSLDPATTTMTTRPPAKKSKSNSQTMEMKELTLYSARVRC